MEQAKSLAWKAVAALALLFFLSTVLLWAAARTTPAQENARAAQAAGVATASAANTAPAKETGKGAVEATKQQPSADNKADDKQSEAANATAQGQSGTGATGEAALEVGASTTSKEDAKAPTVHPAFDVKTGAELYAAACQSCHMPGGVGAKGGAGTKNYPALAGNANLQAPVYPATFILNGAGGMPSFSTQLTDEQIAMLINYLRSDLNKFEGEITPAEIEPLRKGARATNLGDDAG